MGDIGNWEFAAAVAAVTLGLGGLLLFTAIALIGAWRMFGAVSEASGEAARTTEAVQELATQMALRRHEQAAGETSEIRELRHRMDGIAEQQARLQEAIRGLAELAQANEEREHVVRDLEGVVRRLEETIGEIALAVADLNQRIR